MDRDYTLYGTVQYASGLSSKLWKQVQSEKYRLYILSCANLLIKTGSNILSKKVFWVTLKALFDCMFKVYLWVSFTVKKGLETGKSLTFFYSVLYGLRNVATIWPAEELQYDSTRSESSTEEGWNRRTAILSLFEKQEYIVCEFGLCVHS
jgi:hypothetical protein